MYPVIAQWSWSVVIFFYLLMVVIAMIIAYFLLWWVERQFEAGRLWRFAYYMLLPAVVALVV